MNVGINYPWCNYGWDFGTPPSTWSPRAQWKNGKPADPQKGTPAIPALQNALADFRRIGIFAVRWFILGNGVGFGTPPGAAPPQLTPNDPLVQDFTELLRVFAASSLQLLPSLIDYRWCLPVAHKGPGIDEGGRSDVIIDPNKRVAFLRGVLQPLLDASRAFPSTIYAWEVINEPDWVKTVSKRTMESFIKEACTRIRTDFKSTVGFAKHNTMRAWGKNIATSSDQFHYYGNHGDLPDCGRENPCIVGEFATAPHHSWPKFNRQDVLSRLWILKHKGYPAAFLWSAYGKETDPPPATANWQHVQNEVLQFTQGPPRALGALVEGWWRIEYAGKKYFYLFSKDGGVLWTFQQPGSSNVPMMRPSGGDGYWLSPQARQVTIVWPRTGTVEKWSGIVAGSPVPVPTPITVNNQSGTATKLF